jgi:hypothetical protein
VEQQTFLVTTAGESPQADRRQREKRYLILMGLRVIAVVAAILVGRVTHSGPVLIGLIIAAMVLPWLAVVIANAGPSRRPAPSPTLWSPHRRRLESGPHHREGAA